MQLYPYQAEVVEKTVEGFKQFQKQIIVVPTGGGKTPIFAMVAKYYQPGKTLILAHREDLIDQAIAKVAAWTGIRAGKEKAEFVSSLDDKIVVASVQSMIRRLDRWPSDHFELVVADECFPAGTEVDGSSIEEIRPGDFVTTGLGVTRKVTHTSKRKATSITKVRFSSGLELHCTPSHPILVSNNCGRPEWKLTFQLNPGDMVFRLTNYEHIHTPYYMQMLRDSFHGNIFPKHLLEGMRSSPKTQPNPSCRDASMPCLWNTCNLQREAWKTMGSEEPSVLQSGVQGAKSQGSIFTDDGTNKPTSPKFLRRSHEKQQPYEAKRVSGQDVCDSALDGLQTQDSRRERETNACASEDTFGSTRMGNGSNSANSSFVENWISTLLQSGCWQFVSESCSGDRRVIPLLNMQEGTRQKENPILGVDWVESVEILEPGSDGTFGGVCPEGYVYNLSVEGSPTYFANGVLVHNCHHSISPSWQTVINHFNQALVLGVTATPDRADKRSLGHFYENIAAEVKLLDLINQGYLSKIAIRGVPLKLDIGGVEMTNGDFDKDQLSAALDPYLRQIARAIIDHAAFRQTLVFLPLRATSEKFAAICREEGLTAVHIDGESEDRADITQRFFKREIQLVANAMLWSEGYDNPSIDCIVPLRPTKSRALFYQCVGRGTRKYPGKDNVLLLDFLWLHEQHNLIRPAHLIAPDDETADEITKRTFDESKTSGDCQEELDLQGLASEVQVEREKRLQEQLAANEKRKMRYTDAMDFCLGLHEVEVAEFQPTMSWHELPVSEGQAAYLSKMKIDPDSVRNMGHASALIDMMVKRSKLNLASPGQIRLMKQFKHPRPFEATREQAERYLDARIKYRKR